MGMEVNQRQILRDLASVQYSRNDLEIGRGVSAFSDVLEIGPAYEDRIIGWNSFVMRLTPFVDPVTGEIIKLWKH